MRLIGSLKAEAAGIEDLTGLEYATNLRGLQFGEQVRIRLGILLVGGTGKYRVTKPETPNRISDLGPLVNLKNLITLDLECNAVSQLLPLRFLKNLQWLALGENQITSISPLRNLTNLTFLSLETIIIVRSGQGTTQLGISRRWETSVNWKHYMLTVTLLGEASTSCEGSKTKQSKRRMQWCIGSSPVPRASPVRTGGGEACICVLVRSLRKMSLISRHCY